MIYIRISGGLGNQLFQLAAASFLTSNNHCRVVPFIDGLKSYKQSRDPDFVTLLQQNGWVLLDEKSKHRIVRHLSVSARVGKLLPVLGVNDRNIWKTKITSLSEAPRFMDGYFQRGWTEETFACAIANMPVQPISDAAAKRSNKDEVAMHIRGGDFLRLPSYQVVDAKYYVRATELALEQGFKRFFIISDDASYASSIRDQIREKFSDVDMRLSPLGNNVLEDFDLMRAAPARIIGNSTFAWWAAVFCLRLINYGISICLLKFQSIRQVYI
jgi:hypothetical protein